MAPRLRAIDATYVHSSCHHHAAGNAFLCLVLSAAPLFSWSTLHQFGAILAYFPSTLAKSRYLSPTTSPVLLPILPSNETASFSLLNAVYVHTKRCRKDLHPLAPTPMNRTSCWYDLLCWPWHLVNSTAQICTNARFLHHRHSAPAVFCYLLSTLKPHASRSLTLPLNFLRLRFVVLSYSCNT